MTRAAVIHPALAEASLLMNWQSVLDAFAFANADWIRFRCQFQFQAWGVDEAHDLALRCLDVLLETDAGVDICFRTSIRGSSKTLFHIAIALSWADVVSRLLARASDSHDTNALPFALPGTNLHWGVGIYETERRALRSVQASLDVVRAICEAPAAVDSMARNVDGHDVLSYAYAACGGRSSTNVVVAHTIHRFISDMIVVPMDSPNTCECECVS